MLMRCEQWREGVIDTLQIFRRLRVGVLRGRSASVPKGHEQGWGLAAVG